MYPSTDELKPNYRIARELARKILKTASINSFPVLIKTIAKQIPGLHIDGAELQDDISGIQISYNGHDFVRYNQRHAATRNRFTLAHELAHILLGHTNNEASLFMASKDQDKEADTFAAELLMPLEFMKKAIIQYNTVSDLSQAFWVSKAAMTTRVMETGLYKQLKSFN